LDEIAEMPLKLQAKLLQVIQEKKFFPVGGRKEKLVNCRIVAATNRNLQEKVNEGKFREDLYYRLNVIEIKIPPLRERIEDIEHLIYYFLNKFNKKYNFSHQISKNCLKMLNNYSWPGNVRELENVIERLVVTVQEEIIDTVYLPNEIRKTSKLESLIDFLSAESLDEAVNEVEKVLITKAYKKLGSSYKVAETLNISQSKASRLIRKYCKNS
jgi:transcriptional regulator with PAS, ATPase and Fis domain